MAFLPKNVTLRYRTLSVNPLWVPTPLSVMSSLHLGPEPPPDPVPAAPPVPALLPTASPVLASPVPAPHNPPAAPAKAPAPEATVLGSQPSAGRSSPSVFVGSLC